MFRTCYDKTYKLRARHRVALTATSTRLLILTAVTAKATRDRKVLDDVVEVALSALDL